MFYSRHFELMSKYNVGLKTLLQDGLSEPEFYDDFVYKFRKIVDKTHFSNQFKKIVTRYKNKIRFKMNILRQTACMVINPVMVDTFASLFDCTTVGQTAS